MKRDYNDSYRGWPVAPKKQQHPVRGSYLDPRAGRKYHHGIDVSVRDDQPAPGAPQGRSHRVFAIEGGRVWKVIKPGRDGLVRVAHFGYGHVDPTVQVGQDVSAGELIGWTVAGHWHVHLSEWIFPGGNRDKRIPVNPLDRDGKIAPYQDVAPPVILEVRFSTPASPAWRTLAGGTALFPLGDAALDPQTLKGLVDVRARIEDHLSVQGWFTLMPVLETAHHPARVHLTVTRLADGKVVINRDVFSAVGRLSPQGVPLSSHYAPGTRQNLKAAVAVRLPAGQSGRGELWFRLFAKRRGPPYWDTTGFQNGPYRLTIDAWDLVGNHSAHAVEVVVANP